MKRGDKKSQSKKEEKESGSSSISGSTSVINFAADDFNSVTVAKQICERSNQEVIKKQIDGFDNIRSRMTNNIVGILEKDSSLFVSLSQCISMFEREFLEFPQRISEIQKLVDEARQFPIPKFSEVAPLPKVKNSEILNLSSTIVDAPLIYDSLIQQHRISESIDLVVNVKKEMIYSKANDIKYLDEWVSKTSQVLLKEIQGRLKSIQICSEEGQHDFVQLAQLGFINEGVDLFINLASQAIDEKINAIQNTGQLLQYVRETTQILCSEIVEKATVFMKLFADVQYLPKLLVWINETVENKLPTSRPDTFSGNFNLVKDSVIIMRKELIPLEDIGFSTLNIFDTLPQRFLFLLSSAEKQHIEKIKDAIQEDEWDINMDSVKTSKVEDYPVSTSAEDYKSHFIQFLQELKSLYVSEMFYDCSKLLKELLLSYSTGCKDILSEDQPSIDRFCAILVQLIRIENILLPDAFKEFTEITGYKFPDEESTKKESNDIIGSINQMLVKTFISMWSEVLPPDQLAFDGIDELDPHFENAIDVMGQFLNMLNLPQSIFNETADILVDSIIEVADNTGAVIEDASMLNSFDFHWEYFCRSLLTMLPRQANEKLKASIQNLSNQIGDEQNIDDKDRETFKNITAAVNKCMKKNKKK